MPELLSLHTNETTSELPMFQATVFTLLSEGHTNQQIARRLTVSRKSVLAAASDAVEYYDAVNLPHAVDTAIKAGHLILSFMPKVFADQPLLPPEHVLLEGITAGASLEAIAEEIDRPLPEIMLSKQQMLNKIGAWSSPHGVRRGYETGNLNLFNY
jgi:DNA-binding CsgD family transcriptional regulator